MSESSTKVEPPPSDAYELPSETTFDEYFCNYDVLPPECSQSSSFNSQPPDMSEIRVILLGNSSAERTAVANFLSEVPSFSKEEEPDWMPVRGLFKDKEVVSVNTPDVSDPNMSEDKSAEFRENCVRLCAPGPHVFSSVSQPDDFTEEQNSRSRRVSKMFGDQPFHHSSILSSMPRTKASHCMEKNKSRPSSKESIRVCHYRFSWMKDSEHPQLVARLVQVLKENNGEHVKHKGEELEVHV